MYYVKRYISKLDKAVTLFKTKRYDIAVNMCDNRERTFIVFNGEAIYANKIWGVQNERRIYSWLESTSNIRASRFVARDR